MEWPWVEYLCNFVIFINLHVTQQFLYYSDEFLTEAYKIPFLAALDMSAFFKKKNKQTNETQCLA